MFRKEHLGEMPEKMEKQKIGEWGEKVALEYLRSQKYRILEQNYRRPWGEIDLIAQDGETIVFVEVKANSASFGQAFSPEIRVNPKKSRHILRTAQLFVNQRFAGKEKEWRVDILGITFDLSNSTAKIKHFKNVLTNVF